MPKQVRSSLVALVLLVALGVVAAACGDDSPEGGGNGGGPVTLRYAYWGPNQTQAMRQVAREFEAANPNVRIRLELTPFEQYFTKLQTATEGGSQPDVFWINAPNFPQYAANDKLLPMDDLVSQLDLSQYPEPVVNLYKWDDTQYAFPKDFDTIGLWYNKRLFREAGVPFPTDDWTWDDVLSAARELTSDDVFGIAAKLDPQAWYYNLIPQAGGHVINEDGTESGYDTPGAIEALQFTSDLINEHRVSPTLGQMSETDPRQMFQSGKVAMIYDGSYAAIELHRNPYTRRNADVAPLPAGPAAEAVVIHGVGQGIRADTEHPEEAQEFVRFLVGRTGSTIQGETGTTLPSLEDGQRVWVESMPEFNLQAFLDVLPHTYPYPTSRDAAKWGELERELLPDAWEGNRPPAEVGAELAQQMNEVLAAEEG